MRISPMSKSMKISPMSKTVRKMSKKKNKRCVLEDFQCQSSRNCCGDLQCRTPEGSKNKVCVNYVSTYQDPCDLSLCQNDGLCSRRGDSFSCNCIGTGFKGDTCAEDIDECASLSTHSCNSTSETCTNIEGSYRCFPNIVCEGMGNAKCTEPFNGFFDELADLGSFRATSMDHSAIRTWMKYEVWESISMESLVESSPQQYIVFATENGFASETRGLLLLDEFLDFLLVNKTLSPADLTALQEEFGFFYTARRLEHQPNDGRLLSLSNEQCNQILREKVAKALAVCLEAIGIDEAIAEKIVASLVQKHGDLLKIAFATQFVQHDGLTEGFVASVFITFLTTIEWWEVEQIIMLQFEGYKRASALLDVSLNLMALYATGGCVAVDKLEATFPVIFSLFDDVKDDLKNSCFGDTIVQGCEDFYRSGGYGLTTSTVNMGQAMGEITLNYEMYMIKDEIEVFYEGERIYWSGGLVSGGKTVTLSYGPGDSQLIVVRVSAPNTGTAWTFSITCPESDHIVPPPTDDHGVNLLTYTNIKNTILSKNYKFFTGAFDLNLVGIRSPARAANEWDDTFCVLYKDEEGREKIFISDYFTTDPGNYYLENPLKSSGCAILTPGQHRGVWIIGTHNGKYKALVQQGNVISVYRDNNKDTVLDLNPKTIEKDWFGINLHHGSGSSKIGKYSAGCQVFRDSRSSLCANFSRKAKGVWARRQLLLYFA